MMNQEKEYWDKDELFEALESSLGEKEDERNKQARIVYNAIGDIYRPLKKLVADIDDVMSSYRSECPKCNEYKTARDNFIIHLRLEGATYNEIGNIANLSKTRIGQITRKAEEKAEILSIDSLELTVRSANCLQNAGIKTIHELTQWTPAQLLKTRNFGRRSLNEIREVLEERGLSLKE